MREDLIYFREHSVLFPFWKQSLFTLSDMLESQCILFALKVNEANADIIVHKVLQTGTVIHFMIRSALLSLPQVKLFIRHDTYGIDIAPFPTNLHSTSQHLCPLSTYIYISLLVYFTCSPQLEYVACNVRMVIDQR